MVGDEYMKASSTVRVEQLLRNFLDVQHRRASAYNLLHRAFAELLKTSAEAPYQEICNQVTSRFSECSKQTATLRVLRRAGRPSERAHVLEQGHQESSHTHGPLCSHGPESEANGDSGLEMA